MSLNKQVSKNFVFERHETPKGYRIREKKMVLIFRGKFTQKLSNLLYYKIFKK